ncbi:MAG: Ig-like domain-containing protein [Gemmatimonadota bacterium]|nr:Ig-like domain-containing protein [Gemmatimonadota bacterium]
MARAARDPRREAARLGLLVLATACAAAQEPPGGPPDFSPPVVREIRPDSLAIVPGFDDAVVFTFDEVILERQSTEMAKLVIVSPRHDEVRVAWKRTRLEVKPKGGWRENAVYRVVLLPDVADLRNNRMREGAEVVFSTGPDIPDTRVDATVIDWAAHRIAGRGLLEAFPLPITDDSTAYIAQADSAGDIGLTRVPPGDYLLVAVVDENGNRRRDRREAFDSLTVRVDSTATGVFWAFTRDTVGPQLREAARVDSVTVRLTFNQPLAPTMTTDGIVGMRLLPDSLPVALGPIWTTAVYDSVRTLEAAARDSLRQAAADSAAAADTTAVTDTTAVADTAAPRRVPPRADTAAAARGDVRPPPVAGPPRDAARVRAGDQRGGAPAEAVVADSGRVAELLAQRPRLSDQLIVRLTAPLTPGGRYLFEASTVNLSGATASSRTVLAVPEAVAPPDTTTTPDTTATPGR